jgi:uncharacterized cupin superfamily protein
MCILSGHAEVTDADGTVLRAGPGDTVLVPKGGTNALTPLDDLKKIFIASAG